MKTNNWLTDLRHTAPATSIFAVICIGVYLVTAVQARSLDNSVWGSELGSRMVLWGPYVQGEPLGALRALSAVFLHLDIGHLAFNILFLLLVGAEVERFVGTRAYAVAFVAGGLGGSAAVLLMDFGTPTAGASGALYALMAVLVAIASRRSTDLRGPLVLVGVNVIYSLLSSGVSLWGHLGGLAAGAVMAWPLTGPSASTRVLASVVTGIVALGIVLFIAL
ncbi:rhomboid family intramembrane serine protease [Corynebacterium cystitidis]|uniref:Membrane associated serine protease, rhomboid family n=1 Tax=Corynebacterium cystitidis DSM 20524 TaxID=1121357 RepID=A0A1H9UM75_9CORY|nr:rhomboid family intramembrane serine protease [Corynebacterium cystitidis]WJY81037.1 Rhomboid protease GluP [Corynebacterium cystitidis DSM 20524]SES10556.1 Membrane associated serine protease, rhomboid family [Corynebacterium cystitidis DSM 20524]SNV90513.1 transmembrane protein, rhomboid family [Corynebacterium cystitidis]